jgi:hypothetical protein
MSIFRDFFVKEKPVFTGIARGAGGFGFGAGGGAAGPTKMEATGGTTHNNGGYKYHVFLNPDTNGPSGPEPYPGSSGLVVTNPGACDILIVSGGGGGGSGYYGGGGGGGTVVVGTNITLPATSYSIQVGGRGDPGPYPPGPTPGGDGGKSVFGDIDILGGGYGGAGPAGNGTPGSTTGGNAGGGSNYSPNGTSNPYTVPTPYQAYGTWTVNLHDRPTSGPGPENSGGDGAGGPHSDDIGGPGAPVPQFAGPTIPQLVPIVPDMGPTGDYYGGGGGGNGHPGTPANDYRGGYGGGGRSAPGDRELDGRGVAMLGGGGGGSGNPRNNGGMGGTGIVIVRYQV